MAVSRSQFEESIILLNKRAALMHLSLAVFILVITIVKWNNTIKVKFATDIYSSLQNDTALERYLTDQKDNAVAQQNTYWTPLSVDERSYLTPGFYKSQKTSYSIRLGLLVFAFAAITAGFHWYIYKHAAPYLQNVFNNSVQPLRWIEYAITSTIMLVCIASLSEIRDAGTLWLISGLSIAMILTGYSIETAPSGSGNFTGTKLAWFAVGMGYFVIVWAIILQRFTQSARFVSENGDKLPDYLSPLVNFPDNKLSIPSFVYWIVYGLALQYLLFPLVMCVGQNAFDWTAKRHAIDANQIVSEYGSNKRYAYAVGEWGFIILSFVAKGYLVGNVGFGALREDSDVYLRN